MFTRKEIREARREQRILNSQTHLVGRSLVRVSKNEGEVDVTSKVYNYFVSASANGQKRYNEATKSHYKSKSVQQF